ncbi:MAG: diacylglycerol kinase family lipid kinase [Opitutaceae bacterium]|nr:diacylglycerol kinase family lipid kinase [Opitutaceae bacterium]
MKTRLILNPRSGPAGQWGNRRATLARALAALHVDVAIVETRGSGDASGLARAALAEGCTRIIAAGGDGTVNEIAQVLRGTDATLALVPSGSGNGLARHLGIPLRPEPALALLRPGGGVVTAIDTAQANEHFFCTTMGLGFDAEIAARFGACKGRGLSGYLRTGWQAWRERAPLTCVIEAPGETWTQPILLLTIANAEQYGNGVRIAPGASVRDGLLDLIAVSPVGIVGAASLGLQLLLGRHANDRRVRRVAGAAFRVRLPGPGRLHTDGEVRPTGACVDVRIRPRSLHVLVPPGREP